MLTTPDGSEIDINTYYPLTPAEARHITAYTFPDISFIPDTEKYIILPNVTPRGVIVIELYLRDYPQSRQQIQLVLHIGPGSLGEITYDTYVFVHQDTPDAPVAPREVVEPILASFIIPFLGRTGIFNQALELISKQN